jgi:L-cystine uptake protein TcyP (sodium:dicarboxylate symporter family)
MSIPVIINLIVFAGLIVLLTRLRRPGISLSRQVLAGLLVGLAYGFGLQFMYGGGSETITGTLEWTNVVGTSYVNLLMMIVMPLVLTMMISAVVQMGKIAALGKIGGSVVAVLIGTTMIAALVGILMASAFGLTAEGLIEGCHVKPQFLISAWRICWCDSFPGISFMT